MKKHLIFSLLISAIFIPLHCYTDSQDGVPKEGFGGFRGFWNRLDDLKNGNPFRDSYAQDSINKCNLEDIKKYVKAPDFGRHPELLLKLIECNCPEAWEYIDGLEDLDGTKLDPINTLIHYFNQLIEDGYEPASALQELIATFGDDALPLVKLIASSLNPHDEQHQELRENLYLPHANGSTIMHTSIEIAPNMVPELLEMGFVSDDQDAEENTVGHSAVLSEMDPATFVQLIAHLDLSIKNKDGKSVQELILEKKNIYSNKEYPTEVNLGQEAERKRYIMYYETLDKSVEKTFDRYKRNLHNNKTQQGLQELDLEKKDVKRTTNETWQQLEQKVQLLLAQADQVGPEEQKRLAEIQQKKELIQAGHQELLELYGDDND